MKEIETRYEDFDCDLIGETVQITRDVSIRIVLSGTGTDGTLGLRAVKAEGGMTMVQDEKDAEYNGMPKSAIDTGQVDYILPANKMAAQLMKYVKHPYMHEPGKKPELLKKYDDYVQKIYLLIRAKTCHDFSHYKKSTIYRRIERRMAVHQIDRIVDYVRLQLTQHIVNSSENISKFGCRGVTK